MNRCVNKALLGLGLVLGLALGSASGQARVQKNAQEDAQQSRSPCDEPATAEQRRYHELSSEHVRRSLARIALRTDADARTLHVWLQPVSESRRPLPCALFAADALESDPGTAAQVEALLRAPDLAPYHLFFLYGLGGGLTVQKPSLLDALYRLDPNNPAVLSLRLSDSRQQLTAMEIDQLLMQVAQSGRPYRWYRTGRSSLLAQGLLSVAADPAWLALLEPEQTGAEQTDVKQTDVKQTDVKQTDSEQSSTEQVDPKWQALAPEQQARAVVTAWVLGLHMAITPSSLQALSDACDPKRNATFSNLREQSCLQMLSTMAMDPEDVLHQLFALRLWQALLHHQGADANEVVERRRVALWQLEASVELRRQAGNAMLEATALFTALQSEAGELGWIQSTLREAGVSLLPPADWVPSGPLWNQAQQ